MFMSIGFIVASIGLEWTVGGDAVEVVGCGDVGGGG